MRLLGFGFFSPFSRFVDVISAKSWKFYNFNQIYLIDGTSNQKRVLFPQTAHVLRLYHNAIFFLSVVNQKSLF